MAAEVVTVVVPNKMPDPTLVPPSQADMQRRLLEW
jgi:hypothetical protein